MNDRAQSHVYPVVPISVTVLGLIAVAPYYVENSTTTEAGLGGYVVETVLFTLGVFPWLLGHPVRLALITPLVLYVFLLSLAPVVRGRPA